MYIIVDNNYSTISVFWCFCFISLFFSLPFPSWSMLKYIRGIVSLHSYILQNASLRNMDFFKQNNVIIISNNGNKSFVVPSIQSILITFNVEQYPQPCP